MDATIDTPDELAQFSHAVQLAGGHRNLRADVLRPETGDALVFISNRNAAARYKLEAGWELKFTRDLHGGLFG